MEDCINTIIQEMKDIVQCLMSQIEYELRFFFLQIHPFLYELKLCYRRKCDCCVEKKIITWICENHFWHLRRFVTQNHAWTKKIVVYMYIFLRSYTQRVIAIHQTFTECLICFLNYNPIYIYFPINISSKGAMMTFLITIFVTSFTH